MPVAVGVIETLGFPGVLAAADAMVKAAEVTIVFFDKAESGRFIVVIRGHVAEVKRAVASGIIAGEDTYGSEVLSHYIVPNPPENLEVILPIDYTEAVEQFRPLID